MTRTTITCGWLIALALGAVGCDLTYEPDVGMLNEAEDPGVDAAVTDPGTDGSVATTSGPCVDGDPATRPEPLEELARLAETAGAEVVAHVVQKRDAPGVKYFLGSGKIQHIAAAYRVWLQES